MRICCDSKLRQLWSEAWAKAQSAVQGIRVNSGSETFTPDGAGIVDITVDAISEDQLTAVKTDVQANADAITDLKTAVDTNTTTIAGKQDALTAGANISIVDNIISSTASGGATYTAGDNIAITDDIISASVPIAQNNDGSFQVWKDDAVQAKLTEGTLIDISAEGVVSSTLKAGTNITIGSDGTISAAGGTAAATTASEISTDDGRTVQTALDTIEDEIGPETTAGTIQYRLDAIETEQATQNTNISANATAIAGKQDALTATEIAAVDSGITAAKVSTYDSAVTTLGTCYNDYSIDKAEGSVGITMKAADESTSASSTILTAGDNINISADGVISSSASGGGSAYYPGFFPILKGDLTGSQSIDYTFTQYISDTPTVNSAGIEIYTATSGTSYGQGLTFHPSMAKLSLESQGFLNYPDGTYTMKPVSMTLSVEIDIIGTDNNITITKSGTTLTIPTGGYVMPTTYDTTSPSSYNGIYICGLVITAYSA